MTASFSWPIRIFNLTIRGYRYREVALILLDGNLQGHHSVTRYVTLLFGCASSSLNRVRWLDVQFSQNTRKLKHGQLRVHFFLMIPQQPRLRQRTMRRKGSSILSSLGCPNTLIWPSFPVLRHVVLKKNWRFVDWKNAVRAAGLSAILYWCLLMLYEMLVITECDDSKRAVL